MSVITVNSIFKTYRYGFNYFKKSQVLNGVSFDVNAGEVFGLLGPNGAGKTTLLKILLGIAYPTSGEVSIFGKENTDIENKKRLNYLPERPYYYQYLTGYKFINYMKSFYPDVPQSRVLEVLEEVGLINAAHVTIGKYSKGMQQRLGIAQCLLNDADLLFLDEPTTGLDPMAHRDICVLIQNMRARGKTVFLLSHEMNDIENLCDSAAILNNGNLLVKDNIKNFVQDSGSVITFGCDDSIDDKLTGFGVVYKSEDGMKQLSVESDSLQDAIGYLVKCKCSIFEIKPRIKKFGEVFYEIINKDNNKKNEKQN